MPGRVGHSKKIPRTQRPTERAGRSSSSGVHKTKKGGGNNKSQSTAFGRKVRIAADHVRLFFKGLYSHLKKGRKTIKDFFVSHFSGENIGKFGRRAKYEAGQAGLKAQKKFSDSKAEKVELNAEILRRKVLHEGEESLRGISRKAKRTFDKVEKKARNFLSP